MKSAVMKIERVKKWADKGPIRMWRKRHSLTVAELAQIIGMSPQNIYYWETVGGMPRDDSLKRLADAMEIKPETLRRNVSDWQGKRP